MGSLNPAANTTTTIVRTLAIILLIFSFIKLSFGRGKPQSRAVRIRRLSVLLSHTKYKTHID